MGEEMMEDNRGEKRRKTRWRRIVNRGEGGKNRERASPAKFSREKTMADKFMGGRSREGWPTLSRFYEREREREKERESLWRNLIHRIRIRCT